MSVHTVKPMGEKLIDLTDEMIRRYDADHSKLKIVSDVLRPGANTFARGVELTIYKPGTPRNDDFEFFTLHFQEMPYVIAAVPMKDKPEVEAFLSKHGLRLQDGFPHVISSAGVAKFPFRSNSTFSLGGKHDNIMYEGSAAREQAERIEEQTVRGFERAHDAWFAQQSRMWWDGRWWADVTKWDAKRFGSHGLEFHQSLDRRLWLEEDVLKRLKLI